MLCPIPVIKTQNKLKQLAVGDILAVVCTNPSTLTSLIMNSHSILGYQQNDDEITIKKSDCLASSIIDQHIL